MNLVELYEQTPMERHKDIIVHRDRVYMRTPEGTDEYLLQSDGQLQLISSSKEGVISAILEEVKDIKMKLKL